MQVEEFEKIEMHMKVDSWPKFYLLFDKELNRNFFSNFSKNFITFPWIFVISLSRNMQILIYTAYIWEYFVNFWYEKPVFRIKCRSEMILVEEEFTDQFILFNFIPLNSFFSTFLSFAANIIVIVRRWYA